MKRVGYLFDQIASLENLLLASRKAFKGKKDKPRVAAFYFDLEHEVVQLHRELVDGTYRPQPYRVFTIYEPKKRQICAADFRDRVVHHAICNSLDPILESALISDTYACRKGKGTHAAVNRAQYFARKYAFYLKCDITKYFGSIDHTVLKGLLKRKIKDPRVVTVVRHHHRPPLAWQSPWNRIAHRQPDQSVFCQLLPRRPGSLPEGSAWCKRVYPLYGRLYLVLPRQKNLKSLARSRPKDCAAQTQTGAQGQGHPLSSRSHGYPLPRISRIPNLVRLGGKKWARFRKGVRKLERAYVEGDITEEELADRVRSMIAHVQHANTHQARVSFFKDSLYIG